MLKYKSFIEEGDLIIVYLDVRHMYPLTVKRDMVFQSRYGALKHDDVIGKKFGSCVSCSQGYVYVLFPTPELWTITLPHRTQILYAADISLIIVQLELKPGCVVCEAGTGSGSLSHALARAIAPNGLLHTFDFHEKRVEVAQNEFNDHGLGKLIKVEQRDVCTDGFGISGEADAVFLDLPNPWDAIHHAVKALKPKAAGSRLCSFSPCIEQVQRTCKALQDCNFQDIITVECLQRVYDVKKITQSIVSFETKKGGDKAADSELCSNTSDDILMCETAELKQGKKNASSNECETVMHWAAVPPLQTAGHTGYLTYASLCSS